MAENLIIVKKIRRKARHAYHGGAWKIAYADFVTAMMAFFLLMWLMGSTDQATREGISEYFQHPFAVSLRSSEGSGDRIAIIPGGGSDLSSQQKGQVHLGDVPPSPVKTPTPQDIEILAEQQEQIRLEKLQQDIQAVLDGNPQLTEYREQIKLETTPEGLKIQIIDAQNRPMFKLASSEIEEHAKMILKELASEINKLPNKVTINGHTDALPFPGTRRSYSNWELSSERANVARQQLTEGGLGEDKILRVVGLASSIPYNRDNPNDPMNRRISIIVMNRKSEQYVLHDGERAGQQPSQGTTYDGSSPPPPPGR
ncbi:MULTISPECIES: flagellar motor protein MotB [Methylomonas]|uniref:flagellar motor protein MotB n=1 Tax=Methylomonas TaxID=416 RepID=UPI001232D83B|nr:flagellar motor protein MotB [Methylomonas rhizoryzae]